MIFCSPLKRTRQTAKIINEDKKIPIVYEESLVERGYGELEGLKPKEDESIFRNFWSYTANEKGYGVEPVVELCDRVWKILEEIKENYGDKNVLLVTHGATSQAIQAYFSGMDEDGRIPKTGLQNCEIREYEL